MATNLLDISKGHFTDIAIAKAASFLGENNQATYKAINFILPALLGAMANKVSAGDGIATIMNHIKENAKLDMSGSLNSLMGGGTPTQNLIGSGREIISSIFDKGAGKLADWIAGNTNIKIASATSLINMVAPILMNIVSKKSGSSTNSFVNLMNEQLPILQDANLPDGLLKVINFDLKANPTNNVSVRVDDIVEEKMDFSKFMPWVLLAIVVLGGLYFFKTCSFRLTDAVNNDSVAEKPVDTEVTQPVTAPIDSVHKLTLPEGTMEIPKGTFLDKIYTEITDIKADLTKPLTLDSIYFKNASARLTPESIAQVTELSKILIAYPTVEIKIEGHTDNFGIPYKNLRLSFLRAASVKRFLTRSGIAPARIATEGLGDTKPIAENTTPEGMAKNRRIEIYVLKR